MTAVYGADIMQGTPESVMTTATSSPPLPEVPLDVLEFARKHKADGHIRPVLTLARAVFPDAPLRLYLEADPEIEDEWRIIIDVNVSGRTVDQRVDAYDRFTDAFLQAFPPASVCGVFCLRMRSGG